MKREGSQAKDEAGTGRESQSTRVTLLMPHLEQTYPDAHPAARHPSEKRSALLMHSWAAALPTRNTKCLLI